jgi:hypothetical protein
MASTTTPRSLRGINTMSTLAEQVKLAEEEYGFDSKIAQMLRNQLAAHQSGQSAKELYLTGSVSAKKNSPKQ